MTGTVRRRPIHVRTATALGSASTVCRFQSDRLDENGPYEHGTPLRVSSDGENFIMRDRPSGNPKWVIALAVTGMVAFFVWLLVQMAPDAPEHGANLIRIAVGFGFVLVAAIGLAVFPPPDGRRRRHR
jgi:hypothetical protein